MTGEVGPGTGGDVAKMSGQSQLGQGGGGAAVWAGWAFSIALLGVAFVVLWPGHHGNASTAKGEAAAGARAEHSTVPASLPACEDCNVILVSIDTLRADHLGSYGYQRPTSPGIDALAARGVVFERAYSASYVTADAHMSIFTSLAPSVHGVKNAVPAERVAHRLPEELTTLPEWLKDAGYATAAFTSGGNVSEAYGFDRGMDIYQTHADTQTGVQRTLRFAREKVAKGERFFAFLHTYEAHDPYLPPAEIAALFYESYMGDVARSREELLARQPDLRFESQRAAYWDPVDPHSENDRRQLIAAYDAEIRSIDEALVPLWKALEGLGRTMLVLTSDHGEQFGEHGGFLHNDLYEELLHVPLVWVHPDGPVGERVQVPVSTMDIAPTLMTLLGLEQPAQVQGRALTSLHDLPERPLLAERKDGPQALIDGHSKLIARPERRPELYDLRADPDEERDRSRRRVAARQALEAKLHTLHSANLALRERVGQGPQALVLDEKLAEQLRALGYGE